MEIPVYSKYGQKRCTLTAITYQGEWMSECFVTFDVQSAEPIEFEYGDWLEYRGERFELHYEPEVVMQALPRTNGAAYRYEKVKFVSLAEELVNCDFLDYVLNENDYHFTGLPEFSFYAETVKDLADRIQANMNRYSDQNGLPRWNFEVAQGCAGNEKINISVSNISCRDALALVQNDFGVNFIIRGRDVIIGREGLPASHVFRMGRDMTGNLNGLYEFDRTAESDQKIVTRLRAYGSDRNLPRRYYNSLTDADGVKFVPDNMAVSRLMLPDFPEKTLDPYIDSPNVEKLGVIEDTVMFDGSGDLEEIYPSIETATADELRASGHSTSATGRLDEIISAQQIEDNGVGTEQNGEIVPDTETFTIVIKDIGFDISDYLTDETPRISFKTGMLGGREFNIRTGANSKPVWNPDRTWTLTLERVYDEGIGLWFPYNRYNARPEDQFVILGIDMPETYIKIASQRLYNAAREYLSKNDYARSVFTPKVDEIYMARQHKRWTEGHEADSIYLNIKEGDMLMFEEESLNVALSTIFIDKLTIEEGKGPVPTFEITLREEKSVGTLQRIQNQIDSIKSGGGAGGGYSTEQLRQLLKGIGSQLFISKIADDATPYNLSVGGLLSALAGVLIGNYESGKSGAFITSTGFAEFAEVLARQLVKARGGAEFGDYLKGFVGAYISAKGDAELASLFVREDGVFGGDLSSPDFISGFIEGMGWALTENNGEYTLEIDNLNVRNTLRIYQAVISQLVGENDNRAFSAMLEVDHYDPETQTIWLDTQGGKFYNPFRAGDYVEVQQYSGIPTDESDSGYVTKHYEFIVAEVGVGDVALGTERLDWIKFKDFNGGDPSELIQKGDTIVKTDNESDPNRKGIIAINSVGQHTPYIDISYGLKTDPEDSLKGRIGNLQGVRHPLFGWLEGFGAYLSNLYAVGDFRLARTGESVDTQLEMLKERFSSQYSQIIYDLTEDDNFLVNPTFTENLKHWQIKTDNASFILDTEGAFLLNDNFLVADGTEGETTKRATTSDYEGRKMLYIYDSGVRQKNETIRSKMARTGKTLTHLEYQTDFIIDQSTEGINTKSEEKPNTLYLAIKLMALTAGRLKIGFEGSNGTLPNPTEIVIGRSRDWQIIEWEGTWDGEGDFVLEYTGEVYVCLLSLTDNPLNEYKKETGTRIEQTTQNIKLLGWNIDAANKKVTDLGVEVNSVDKKVTAFVETTDKELGEIKGSQLELSDSFASLKSYTESSIGEIKGSQLELSDSFASLKSYTESQTGEMQKSIAEIKVTSEKIESRVENAEGDISSIQQNVHNITTQVTKTNQTVASISQTVMDNKAEIEQKVGYDEVIASINMSAEKENGSLIKIRADKVEIAGNLSINDVFTITEGGDIIFDGVTRLKSDYSGKFSDTQLYYLPSNVDLAPIDLGVGLAQIGKVIRLYNSSPLGGKTYTVYGYKFRDYYVGTTHYLIRDDTLAYNIGPQEVIEMSCFKSSQDGGAWVMTGRFAYQNFRNETLGQVNGGRNPICWAMGSVTFRANTLSVSGQRYDGISLLSRITPQRLNTGVYRLHFSEGFLPEKYYVMCQPTNIFHSDGNENTSGAGIVVKEKTSTSILFYCSDDETTNDLSFDFMIFDSNSWFYNS